MARPGHEPQRTCVACHEEAGKQTLVRVVRGSDGSATVDPTGHAPGRGAYLHRRPTCVETARKRRHLERALGAEVLPDFWSALIP